MGFFIARIPILLFQAIQAALLPKLAALAGAGKHDDFRAGLKKLLVIVVGVGVLGVVAGATIGPIAGEILFGEKFNLGNVDLGLLAAGSALFILALTLAQALIALLGHGRVLAAWCLGLAVVRRRHRLQHRRPVPPGRARLPRRMRYRRRSRWALLLLGRLRTETPESLSRLVEPSSTNHSRSEPRAPASLSRERLRAGRPSAGGDRLADDERRRRRR